MTFEELQITSRLNNCRDLVELDVIQHECEKEILESMNLQELFDNTFDRLERSVNVRRMF